MKCIQVLLLFIIVFICLDLATSENFPTIEERKFIISKGNEMLMSVEPSAENDKSTPKKLIIDDEKLTTIKPFAFKKLNITELEIRFAPRRLNLQQKSFAGLSKLEVLKFNSGIVKLGRNLFKLLGSLLKLYITIDDDSSVDDGITNLPNLKFLHIENSNLNDIRHDTFRNMISPISHLELFSNNIKNIEPNSFVSLKYLTSLRIEVNQLEILHPGTFNGLRELQELSLWSNSLTRISKNIFNELMSLKKLALHDNKIKEIDPAAFSGLNLASLHLQNNQLTKIEKEMFEGLTVASLDLSSNKIVNIEDDAFARCKVYRTLHLNENLDINVTNRATWGVSEHTEIYSITIYNPRPLVSKLNLNIYDI